MSRIECSHPRDKWEYNPKTKVYTLRCTRCSRIKQTMTEKEWEQSA